MTSGPDRAPAERETPLCALSTMWSQGNFRRPGDEYDDMAAFARKTAELGYTHVEINYVVPPHGVDALLQNNHIAFSSVHSPCPRIRMPDGRMSDAYNLASLDDDERRLAVEVARASVDTAVRASANYLVVHLGGIGGGEIFEEERTLRKLFDDGVRDGEEVEAIRARAHERRREGAVAQLPRARRSLAEIAEYAAANGVTIGLENRYHFHEFPDPDEMRALLEPYPLHVAGFWIDLGHVEVIDRLGLVPRHRWLDELNGCCVGSHIHDTDGLADHRAPGYGTSDWPHYAARLPAHVPRVMEINQRQAPERVAAAPSFLRSVGILPAEQVPADVG